MISDVPVGQPGFVTTQWSDVIHAAQPDSPEGERALADLCRVYWYPLFVHARKLGHNPDDAQDLTQEFFARLLEKNYVRSADRTRGKFRWFLLTAFKCFLANEWDRAHAKKRGGNAVTFSIDQILAEERYDLEPAQGLTADQLFDRRWALDLLERARGRLRGELASGGKIEKFKALESYVVPHGNLPNYSKAAKSLGMSEPAVRQGVHRLRKRFGEIIRAEVAATVVHPDETEEELRYLLDVVGMLGGGA